MRWHLRRTKLLFALIPIISIVFYVLTANNNIFADQSFSAFDIYQQICDTAVPVAGKNSPADYTAAENFAIAADVYRKSDAVSSVTEGTVTAMGFYKQTVLNKHIRYNDHIFSESVSLSAIASVAEQRYFKEGALLFRQGTASGSAVKSWSDTIVELTTATYRQRYGVVPQEITKYAVQAKNIQEGNKISENADGTFTYELVLDAAGAMEFARYEMMTFANVTAFPKFYTCRLVFTIDDTWHIRTLESYDTYKIDLMGGIKCDSRLVETYTFDNVTMPDSAQIFIDYVPTGNTGEIGGDKSPADYLSEAYGDYISGKRPLALTATFDVLGETLPLRASIDIAGQDYRFMLGDDVFAAYTPNGLFVRLNEKKYSLSSADITAAAGGGLDLGMSADELLTMLFAEHTVTHTDTHVYIRMPFTLFGVKLDVNMGLKKTDEGVKADTIDATIEIGNVQAVADIDITDQVTLPPLHENEYVSLRPLLQAVQNTAKAPAMDIAGTLEIGTGDSPAVVRADIHMLQTAKGLNAAGTLEIAGRTLSVTYVDDTVFVRLGNTGIRAHKNDLKTLTQAAAALLPAGASGIDLSAVLQAVLPQLLPGELRISTLFSMLSQLNYADNTLSLTVTPQQNTPYTLQLCHNDRLSRAALQNFSLAGVTVNATLALSYDNNAPVTVPSGNYTDAAELLPYLAKLQDVINSLPFAPSELAPFVTPLINTFSSQTIYVRADGVVTAPDAAGNAASETFTAGITVRMPQGGQSLAVACALKVSGQTINAVWQNGTVYIDAGALAVKLRLSQAPALIENLRPLLGDATTFLQNISAYLGNESAQQAISALQNLQTLLSPSSGDNASDTDILALLASIDFDKLQQTVAGIRIENGTISLPVAGGRVSLTANNDYITALAADGIALGNASLDINAALTPDVSFAIDVDDAAYFDLANLSEFAPSLGKLLSAPAVRLEITDGMLNTSMLSGAVRGRIELQLTPVLRAQADLMLHDHTVQFVYNGETNAYCARINNIKIAFTADEVQALIAELQQLIKQAGGTDKEAAAVAAYAESTVQTVSLLQSALGGQTLKDIFGYVKTFAPCGNGFTVGLNVNEFSLTAAITATGDALAIDVLNFNYGADVYDSRITAALSPIDGLSAVDLSESECVRIAELQSYLRPAVDLLRQQYYTVSFGGNVTASNGGVTAIGGIHGEQGVLQLQRTQGFMNLYVEFALGGRAGDHTVQLYLIDGTDYTDQTTSVDKNALTAYVNYNSLYAKIDYASVLGIAGSLCDILNVQLPAEWESLLQEAGYEHYQTDVFQTMNIAGLEDLRETLRKLLGTGEDMSNVASGGASGMLGLVSDDMLHGLLRNVSLGLTDGALQIHINNGLFDPLYKGTEATITVAHNGRDLTNLQISNLKARGDTVNFTAAFSFDPFEPVQAPQGAMDFGSADGLLKSLIQTADLRDFEINGEIKMELPVIKDPVIPFNVKVRIKDDGSTVAAVKLQVPFVSAVVSVGLTRTDSYIYFADDMLYFIVDVWNSGAWSEGSYKQTEYISATPQEFLSDPAKYLFYLLRMGSMIRDPIESAIKKGGDEQPSKNPADILKAYSYANNAYGLTVSLCKLAGNSDMGDLNVSLATTADGYIRSLALDTAFAGIATVRLQNTTLSNLRVDANNNTVTDENGKRVQPLSAVRFGQSQKFAQLGLSDSMDDLESSLGKIFPVEAAETSAHKTAQKTERAQTAAQKASKASQTVAACEKALDKAQQAYAAAVEKLASIPEDSFGYDRAQANVEYTARVLEHAKSDVTEALADRLTAAQSACDAAQSAYAAAQLAAQYANAALERDKTLDHEGITDVRAYAAAGDAALCVVNAVNACDDALDKAYAAALQAGDSGKALCEHIQAVRNAIHADRKATAALVTTAANRACESAIAQAKIAQAQTDAAHKEAQQDSGVWIAAAQYAGDTLAAVAAMQITDTAAVQAAALSENETLIAEAAQNAAIVADTAQAAAVTAAQVAVDAAENIALLGKTAVNTADEHARNKRPADASRALESALYYAQAAQTASESARRAVEIVQDASLIAAAQAAAVTAAQTATYIGDIGINTAFVATQTAAEQLQNAQTDANTAAAQAVIIAQLVRHAAQCHVYALTQENTQTLYAVYTTAVQAVTQAAQTFAPHTYTAAQDNKQNMQTAYTDAINECNNTSWNKNSRYSEVTAAANAVTAQADQTALLAAAARDLLQSVQTVFDTAAHSPVVQTAHIQSVQNALGNETSGFMGAIAALKASADNASDAAPKLTTRADGLLKVFGKEKEPIAAAASANASATAAAQNVAAAQEVATALYRSFASLLSAAQA
ncbi:MAG: hypothetical protein HFE46_04910 [Clostridia bacterium]|nr:hypothetical protein [Clostridia bacterium]